MITFKSTFHVSLLPYNFDFEDFEDSLNTYIHTNTHVQMHIYIYMILVKECWVWIVKEARY
jgi:hypothetical protein